MIRYVLLSFALTALIVGFQVISRQQDNSQPLVSTAQPDESAGMRDPKPRSSSQNTSQPASESPKTDAEVLQTIDPDPLLDEQMIAAGPWGENEDPALVPGRYQRQGLDARALTINTEYLSAVNSGDELFLYIPQLGQAYQMEVEQVGRHLNGDRSFKGHLVDTDLPYSVIMTEGANSTFATINTPDGSFMLEASGDDGWIMSLADLDYMIDPSLQDFRIPNIAR